MSEMDEDEKRHLSKALTGDYRWFDPRVFSDNHLHELTRTADKSGNYELKERLVREELRRD